ncbi:hypothetical protein, partial [Kibdelosporangium philippinense]|uniref:hypothetical protein n=1 Tax=Kibdelosporangium philippinense TaxID=211113 RepID=UPI0035ECBB0B
QPPGGWREGRAHHGNRARTSFHVPSTGLSWTIGLGPLIIAAIIGLVVWIRGRGQRRMDTWTW